MRIEARQAVELAKRAVELTPPLPEGGFDAVSYEAWERFMLHAARRIAAALDHDGEVLRLAIGPPIEVGQNPAWRVLLSCALLAAEADAQDQRSAALVAVG